MLTISERRNGESNGCFEVVIGYDCKFKGGYKAFLCGICMDKQIDHRMAHKSETDPTSPAKNK